MTAQVIDIAEFRTRKLSVVDHNGEGWFTGEQIGEALEYESPRKSINEVFRRHEEELAEYSVDLKLRSTDGKTYNTRVYNEEGVMVITMLSRQPLAREFRRWAVGVLKAHRRGQAPAGAPKPPVAPPAAPIPTITIPRAEWEAAQHALAVAEKDRQIADLALFKADILQRQLKPKPKRPPQTPIGTAERDWICSLLDERKSRREITKITGRSESAIYWIEKEHRRKSHD